MGSKNPIDEMRFYSKENPDEAKPIHKHLVSQMLPETFQEKLIFIFCKSMEMSTLEAVYRLSGNGAHIESNTCHYIYTFVQCQAFFIDL